MVCNRYEEDCSVRLAVLVRLCVAERGNLSGNFSGKAIA
jgi:hypothetical protein